MNQSWTATREKRRFVCRSFREHHAGVSEFAGADADAAPMGVGIRGKIMAYSRQ
jgi:hypothetical protein